MNRILPQLLALTGWTLLSVLGAWALVVALIGFPPLSHLNVVFGLLAVALVMIASGQELERLQRQANR